jgi:hypothetical protein
MERVARITAILIAATMAAAMVTIRAIENLSTLTANLTSRPLRTLIDLVPAVPAVPAKPNYPHYLPAVPILTGAELMALWGAEFVDEPAPVRPVARRRPAKATKVALGA